MEQVRVLYFSLFVPTFKLKETDLCSLHLFWIAPEKANNGGDDEDREQECEAKHFAKRSRRNRVLEEFEGDSQFLRSRLIYEDVSMQ